MELRTYGGLRHSSLWDFCLASWVLSSSWPTFVLNIPSVFSSKYLITSFHLEFLFFIPSSLWSDYHLYWTPFPIHSLYKRQFKSYYSIRANLAVLVFFFSAKQFNSWSFASSSNAQSIRMYLCHTMSRRKIQVEHYLASDT